MRTTQRFRFKQNDIYQELEWATPRGTITFKQYEINGGTFYRYFYTDSDGQLLHSRYFEDTKKLITAVNKFISWKEDI